MRSIVMIFLCFLLFVSAAAPPAELPKSTPPKADAPPKVIEPKERPKPSVVRIPPKSADLASASTAILAPPLGLTDARRLLEIAWNLQAKSPEFTETERRKIKFCVEQTALYMKNVVRAMSGGVRYNWRETRKRWVEPGESDTRTFTLDEPARNVLAMRFRVGRWGDIAVIKMVIYDTENRPHAYETKEIGNIAYDLPKWEVFYLSEPIDAQSVSLTMAHDGDKKRRMYVEFGEPETPDYAREIMSFSRLSLQRLEAGKFTEARDFTRRALLRLRDFQNSLALSESVSGKK